LALVGALLLSLPARSPAVPDAPPHGASFSWNQDSLWHSLEARYVALRTAGCDDAAGPSGIAEVSQRLDAIATTNLLPADPQFDSLELAFFALGPMAAACPASLHEFVALSGRLREVIKTQSRLWNPDDPATKQRVYRLLYGARAAVEEAMLQHPDTMDALLRGRDEPSATPSAMVHGVRIHSGDMLVSRGGYPTSALIARGNDFPGNFSHVGLVHVDSATHSVSVIEAHIEVGVAVASAEAYLADKKLRVMVLRPRADLPAMQADPMLPHRAASLALARARAGHIPYDFTMDYTDPSKLFCSEVASSAYHDVGMNLWMGLSTITRPGIRRWLSAVGVRHFETQEPSDLEYDPQLVVVAEWRDPATLWQDHVDNAVLDAMLEDADSGTSLDYSWYRLPLARLAKAYSTARVMAGGHGPIPEGMSAASALRHEAFVERQRTLAASVHQAADQLEQRQGYRPSYWTLLDLARREVAAGAL
ncbi:MAG TPA: YiiX/YebB-like N1pC/P60 family cysteine hydrolase, partial [Gemmatimonadales bacterium]|nr:YiiX/YebB-like N1pC/P60 family cysteine hydrolase [Gemmatimonadales bacterium]